MLCLLTEQCIISQTGSERKENHQLGPDALQIDERQILDVFEFT